MTTDAAKKYAIDLMSVLLDDQTVIEVVALTHEKCLPGQVLDEVYPLLSKNFQPDWPAIGANSAANCLRITGVYVALLKNLPKNEWTRSRLEGCIAKSALEVGVGEREVLRLLVTSLLARNSKLNICEVMIALGPERTGERISACNMQLKKSSLIG